MLKRVRALLLFLVLCTPAGVAASTVDFEDVGANLPIGSDFFYDGRSATPGPTDFVSGGVTFHNQFDPFTSTCCWSGFAYSQVTDTTTPGFGNQYSAYAGAGAGGSDTFAIGFTGGSDSSLDFGTDVLLSDAFVTNTTFAALAMLDGDPFSKKFGGASGDDPDFFKLVITGIDGVGAATGSVELLLADYRFDDNGLDYVLDAWTSVDLSSLGSVRTLEFTLESSDLGPFGINTPAYFALDDLEYTIVPEPGSGALLALGLAGLRLRRRAR